jgi:hypothetical protein
MTAGRPDPAAGRLAAGALRQAAEAVAAARLPRRELAPLLATAACDLYRTLRGLGRFQVAGHRAVSGPGTVSGQVRQAAHSAGMAWQYLAVGCPRGTGVSAASTAGPADALQVAAARAARACSGLSGSEHDREEILTLVMAAAAAMAATADYLAAGADGIRARRCRNAANSLDIAAEQLRQALACCAARPIPPNAAPPIRKYDQAERDNPAGPHVASG